MADSGQQPGVWIVAVKTVRYSVTCTDLQGNQCALFFYLYIASSKEATAPRCTCTYFCGDAAIHGPIILPESANLRPSQESWLVHDCRFEQRTRPRHFGWYTALSIYTKLSAHSSNMKISAGCNNMTC